MYNMVDLESGAVLGTVSLSSDFYFYREDIDKMIRGDLTNAQYVLFEDTFYYACNLFPESNKIKGKYKTIKLEPKK